MKIVITTPNNFSKQDKSLMIKNGICVIEAKNPDEVKVISDADFGDANQLMLSAFDALHGASSSMHERFFQSLYKRMQKKDE